VDVVVVASFKSLFEENQGDYQDFVRMSLILCHRYIAYT
jgi:hypothetical protein